MTKQPGMFWSGETLSQRPRTPAMQAGLVSQRLALRDIFTAGGLTRRIFVGYIRVSQRA